jgi:hypothetical protein
MKAWAYPSGATWGASFHWKDFSKISDYHKLSEKNTLAYISGALSRALEYCFFTWVGSGLIMKL